MPSRATRRSSALDRVHSSTNQKSNQHGGRASVLPKSNTKTTNNVKKSNRTQENLEPDAQPADPDAKSHDGESFKNKPRDSKTSANVGKKRKRSAKLEPEDGRNSTDINEIPHNMDSNGVLKHEPVKGQEPPDIKPSGRKHTKAASLVQEKGKSARNNKKKGTATDGVDPPVSPNPTPEKLPTKAESMADLRDEEAKSSTKKETYGLSEGVSPFPNYPRPTPEDCYTVAKLLQKAHPNCQPRPQILPEPSQVVAGCGDVPSILDAMIRTLLSAATNGRNSSSAYQGMIKRYGNRQTGVGKGSVDYNAVRLASQADLEKAIASGGLAKNKSKNIKAILDMVHEENQRRSEDFVGAIVSGNSQSGPGAFMRQDDGQKNAEIRVAEEDFLSLDHLHHLPTYAAISHLTKYPGIGVKTAACVALFCMQRDCFAVDTHVFRLCKWLGWVPDQSAPDYVKAKGEPRVDRDPTFSHLEVRIPDELKYNLHQLFIQHGKKCGRCRGNTSENHPDWAKGCPIEELVDRKGPRKGGKAAGVVKKPTAKIGKKRKHVVEEDDEEEEIEMSDLVEDEDDEEIEEAMPDLDDEEEFNVPAKTARRPRRSTKKKTLATNAAASEVEKDTSAKRASRKLR